ncbi:hypothetical protein F5Y06DRAFT_150966 [Hypoxylon sp. FL0890]|nr:hypothetical protein F5Y06DRAFT_150966 [Hypoxylon sp. FL0890]
MSEPRKGPYTWIRNLRSKAKHQEGSGTSSEVRQELRPSQSNSLPNTEPYGLFEFLSCTGQPGPASLRPDAQIVDIIAVHGLGGSWRSTWSAGKDDNSAIWLRDRLPQLLAPINVHPRIRTFGYDSSYVFTSSASDLESCAEDLLTRIRILRQTDKEKQAPIIFVAHSLGGLVVKQVSIDSAARILSTV